MRIYIFKSETKAGLQAFAGDEAGSMLPQQPRAVDGDRRGRRDQRAAAQDFPRDDRSGDRNAGLSDVAAEKKAEATAERERGCAYVERCAQNCHTAARSTSERALAPAIR